MSRNLRSLLLITWLASSAGCTGLRLRLVDTSVRKPSNVALYFTVDTTAGEPVPNLVPENFVIYEDQQPISVHESQQTILQPQIAAIHYTMLLVDMSGSVSQSGDVPALVAAASSFAERVGPYQRVGVYAFDGSPHLTPIAGFGAGNVGGAIASLGTFHPKDPSTNLYGAVLEAVQTLHKQMDSSTVPLRFGTLVVFTDGTDQAHRASAVDVDKALDDAGFDTFVIAVGTELNHSELRAIGRSGVFASASRGDISKGFDDIARRIEGFSKRYYLLSYCSPSRAGEHELEVEARAGKLAGRLRQRFKADGFGPNCDPNQKPAFDVRHPRAETGPAAH